MIRYPRNIVSSIISSLKLTVRLHSCSPGNFKNQLKNLPSMEFSELSNGLTVVTEERQCYNACIGYFFDTGSRYEDPIENGISHFFEHLAFKGTASRSKTALEEEMSATGARFKCFTTREMVGFYAECLSEHLPSIFDILTDCLFNNPLSTAEIELQKNTVYLEMLQHDTELDKLIDDNLHATAFQGTPLAQTVMGPSCNLYNFCQKTIRAYRNKTLDASKTVLAAVGGVRHDQILQLATCLEKLQPAKHTQLYPCRYTGSEMTYRNDLLPVAHVGIAVEGPHFSSPDRVVMDLAAAVVGGWDKSQPGGENLGTRVARSASTSQLCESYKAFNIPYKDTGLWGIQFVSPRLVIDEMIAVVQDEWMRLCTIITEGELQRAKAEVITKVLTNNESTAKTCREIGRWMLYNKYTTTLYDRLCEIDTLKVQDIRDTCTKYIYDKCPAVAAIGATETLPDYTRLRAGMYWLRW